MVTYSQIPPVMRNAVISIEDRHFESHWGIDVLRIVQGGGDRHSGMAQGTGRQHLDPAIEPHALFDAEKSFRRKIQEALLAIQIERHFTKPQIFTMYSNQVPMGYGNYGFGAARNFIMANAWTN